MSLKTGFATVLKAIWTSRGLTHKNMSGASSRGYMLKLEHGKRPANTPSEPRH